MPMRRDWLFYGGTLALVIIIGQLPIILHFFRAPAGFYFPFLTNAFYTAFYFPALIQLGTGPDWLITMPYIPQDQRGTLLQILYILLGKIAWVFSADPFLVMAMARVFGGVLVGVAAIFILRRLLAPPQARLAWVLFLFAQPLPFLNTKNILAQDLGHWVWDVGEATWRLGVIYPHYTIGIGSAVLSLALLLLLQSLSTGSAATLVLSMVLAIVSGFVYPMPVFILLVSLGIGWLLHRKHFIPIALYSVAILIPLFILKAETARGFPWNAWLLEGQHFNDPKQQFELHYIQQVGIVVGLSLLGIAEVIRKAKASIIWAVVGIWAYSAFLTFPLANILSIAKYRLVFGGQMLPLAIIAALGINRLYNVLHQRIVLRNILFRSGLAVFLVYFGISTVVANKYLTDALWPIYQNVYFSPGEMSALSYLANNVPKDAVVLAAVYPSNYIPAFARVRTIIGYPPNYYQQESEYQAQLEMVVGLLSGKLPASDAKAALNRWRVAYVYAGNEYPQELYPEYLIPVFTNQAVTIYKVRRS